MLMEIICFGRSSSVRVRWAMVGSNSLELLNSFYLTAVRRIV